MTPVLFLVAVTSVLLGAALAFISFRTFRNPGGDGAGDRLALLLGRLAAVSLVSIPVLWLTLSAEVGEWPGLVCVNGVLRLGSRSRTAAAALPYLLATVGIAKVIHGAAAGTGLTLHRIDRSSRDAPLARRAALWTAAAGVFAVIDGAATLGWIFVPREGGQISAGCCTSELIESVEAALPPSSNRTLWTALFLGAGGAAVAALSAAARFAALRRPGSPLWIAWFLAAGAATFTGVRFATTTLAPSRLRLPLHECAYCLLDRAPENWAGVAGLAAMPALTCWAWTAARAARSCDPAAADAHAARLLRAAAVACLAVLVLGASGRWLA